MSASNTSTQAPFAIQKRARSATQSFVAENGAKVVPLSAAGALNRAPLFRSNSFDRYREKRRLKRQWERRHNSIDSTNGEGMSGAETGPEDMIETDEPFDMLSSTLANNGSSTSLCGRRYEFAFNLPGAQ